MNTSPLHTEHRFCHLAFQEMRESFGPDDSEVVGDNESMVQISSLGCDGRVHLEQRMGNMRQRYERAPGPVRDACGRCCGQVERMTQVMDRNLVSHCQGTMERMGSFAVEECGVEAPQCHEHMVGSTFCVDLYDERPQRWESSYCSLDRGLAAQTALPVPDILGDVPTVAYAPCCVPIAGGCQFQYPPSCFCANVGPNCYVPPQQRTPPVPDKQLTQQMTRLEQLIKQLVLLIPQLLKQQRPSPSPSPSPSTKKKEDADRKWKKMEQQQKKLETQLEEQKADYEKKLEDQKKKHEEELKDKSSQEKEKKDNEEKANQNKLREERTELETRLSSFQKEQKEYEQEEGRRKKAEADLSAHLKDAVALTTGNKPAKEFYDKVASSRDIKFIQEALKKAGATDALRKSIARGMTVQLAILQEVQKSLKTLQDRTADITRIQNRISEINKLLAP